MPPRRSAIPGSRTPGMARARIGIPGKTGEGARGGGCRYVRKTHQHAPIRVPEPSAKSSTSSVPRRNHLHIRRQTARATDDSRLDSIREQKENEDGIETRDGSQAGRRRRVQTTFELIGMLEAAHITTMYWSGREGVRRERPTVQTRVNYSVSGKSWAAARCNRRRPPGVVIKRACHGIGSC